MIVVLLAAVIFVPMLIEARRSAHNERAQRARGGIEPAGDVYPLMQAAYPGAFVAMLVETAIGGGPTSAAIAAAGAVLFAAGKALKWWAILTLGQAWTFRVIVVPAARRVRRGPYRFLDHPNYVGAVGELLGATLMTGAQVAGPIATLVFAVLILKRISVENRALENLVIERPEDLGTRSKIGPIC
jgi:methyltransferase